jgi:CRP-like cAMP-binding protein
MRQATLLCPSILSAPAPSITIRRSGLISCVYTASFSVADSPLLAGAKSALLRQTRRMFQHAGVGRSAPPTPAELLGSLVLFEALSSEEVQFLAATLVDRAVHAGEAIFGQGANATSIFVVKAGVLEVSRHVPPSKPETLGRIGPGEYIGELGLITGSPRASTLTALTDASLLELPGESLTHLLRSNAALKTAMERSVRRGLALLDRDDAARAVPPSEQATDLFARIKAFFHV